MAAHLNAKGLTLFGKHTTAFKVSIERENFKAIQVSDLNKLSAEKVFEKIEKKLIKNKFCLLNRNKALHLKALILPEHK